LFVWRQLMAPRPLIRLQLFRIPALTCRIIANGIAHSSLLATILLMRFLLQRGRGLWPGQTAELITVMQVFMLASAYLAGWLYSRRPTPVINVTMLTLIAGALFVLGRIGADMP